MASTDSANSEDTKVTTAAARSAELECCRSPPRHTPASEQLISPDHRRRLLEQATKQFRRRRAFSVLNFESASISEQSSACSNLPFPLISPNHREKLLQRAADTLKRHRRSSQLPEEDANSAPPSVIDLWRDEEKSGNRGSAAILQRSRTMIDSVRNDNASDMSS